MTGIEIVDLRKEIKGNVVLRDISMRLFPGHIYGFRGKNGCGKTMLLRAVCGLIIPSRGRILINGKELHKDMDVPDSVGVLIENPSFLPEYTGFQNLKMLASIRGGVANQEIETALIRVGLEPHDKRQYRKFSLGMKQKLGIANAIMGEPDIILLDEPINALDEDSVKRIKETLFQLRRKEKLVIVVCHDREELEYLCDTIYEMQEGTLTGVSEKK